MTLGRSRPALTQMRTNLSEGVWAAIGVPQYLSLNTYLGCLLLPQNATLHHKSPHEVAASDSLCALSKNNVRSHSHIMQNAGTLHYIITAMCGLSCLTIDTPAHPCSWCKRVKRHISNSFTCAVHCILVTWGHLHLISCPPHVLQLYTPLQSRVHDAASVIEM